MPIRDGYLHKLGYNSGKWQRRFFELSEDAFTYASQPGGKIKGRLLLGGAEVAAVPCGDDLAPDALGQGTFAKSPVPMHAFKVRSRWSGGESDMRSFYFGCNDATDLERWVAAVSQVIKTAPAAPEPTAMPAAAEKSAASPAAASPAAAPAAAAGGLGGLMAMAQGLQGGNAAGAAAPAGGLGGLMAMAQGLQGGNAAQAAPAGGLGGLGGLMQMAQGLQGAAGGAQNAGAGGLSGLMQMAKGMPGMQHLAGGQDAAALPVKPAGPPPPNCPPVPYNGTKPLPAFPEPDKVATGQASMSEMLAKAQQGMAAMQAHQNDPHLSKQDNAAALAGSVSRSTGLNERQAQMIAALKGLEPFTPEGLVGFVVTETPANGTLGQEYGLEPYDLIFGYEGQRCTLSTSLKDFGTSKKSAFQSKGSFELFVFSIMRKNYRTVTIMCPPGKPNAILGLTTSLFPFDEASATTRAEMIRPENMVCKGWTKTGMAFISTNEYYRIDDPLTEDNKDVYVKVSKGGNGMYISTGEYHPLYNYKQLDEPLFVEAYENRSGMLVSSGDKHFPLPMTR